MAHSRPEHTHNLQRSLNYEMAKPRSNTVYSAQQGRVAITTSLGIWASATQVASSCAARLKTEQMFNVSRLRRDGHENKQNERTHPNQPNTARASRAFSY